LRAGTPKGPAAPPERKVTTPILKGFSAAGAAAGAWARAVVEKRRRERAQDHRDNAVFDLFMGFLGSWFGRSGVAQRG
jgi:hypothetical protein